MSEAGILFKRYVWLIDTVKSGKWTKEDAIAHIKSDLRLVAGGGYNSEHIHNVKFKIESI